MGEIARLEFDDLKDNMFYEVYITVASILDYGKNYNYYILH